MERLIRWIIVLFPLLITVSILLYIILRKKNKKKINKGK